MKALVVIDMENEWTEKLSPYYLGDISRLIIKINKLIDFCRKKSYKIIFVTHVELEGKEFAKGTKRVKIIKDMHKEKGDILVKKNKISPFYKTTLHKKLEGVNEVIICGVVTNLCVRSMAHDAYDRDFAVTIIDDGCKTFDFLVHDFTLKDLKETREEISIIKTDDFIKKNS
jgi:ureidoacrylate peracid hydrolase